MSPLVRLCILRYSTNRERNGFLPTEYESEILFPAVTEYLRANLCSLPKEILPLDEELRKETLPIVRPETARFLSLLCTLKQPKRILEIGTCVGYSALIMRYSCGASIVTMDRYDYMIGRAKENFQKYDPDERITLLEGQASELLPSLTGEFDFIFLDAAKAQYPAFLPHILQLLAKDGLFLADNVLFEGLTADSRRSSRRDKTIVRRLRSFISSLNSNPGLKTSLLPIGDCVTLSVRTGLTTL